MIDAWERGVLENLRKQVKEVAPQLDEQNRIDLLFRVGVAIGLVIRLNTQIEKLTAAPTEEDEICPICEKEDCSPDCEAYEDGY